MVNVPDRFPRGKTALVLAHPGHELRCFHWFERARPAVYVLTDGSGHHGVSRLGSTTRLLEAVGATQGSIYGRFPDRVLYQALLGQDDSLFQALVDELAEGLLSAGVDYVVADNADAYNPSHDVCRLLTNAAVARVNQRRAEPLRSYEFSLVGAPDACPADLREQAVWIRLDDAALERKLRAAHGYPELAGEVAAALAEAGRDAFRTECLRPVTTSLPVEVTAGVPYYEQYGEQRVKGRTYQEVVRRSHVAHVAQALGLPALMLSLQIVPC